MNPSIYNNKFTLSNVISNWSEGTSDPSDKKLTKEELIGKHVVGYIYDEYNSPKSYDSSNLFELKSPKFRIIEGKIIKVLDEAEKPFLIGAESGDYLCNFIRIVTFINPKLDDIIRGVKKTLKESNIEWSEFKEYLN